MIRKLFTHLNAFVEVNFLFKNLLIPLALLEFYCGGFAWVSARLQLDGVNAVFATRMAKYLLVVLVVACALTVVLFLLQKKRRTMPDKPRMRVRWDDLVFVLLPMTTLIQYIITNHAAILPRDIIFTLLFFVVLATIFIVLIPALLGFAGSPRALKAVGLAFVVTIVNMAMLSQQFHWFDRGAFKIQLAYFFALFAVAWLLTGIQNRKTAWLLLGGYLILNSALQVLPQASNTQSGLQQGESAARIFSIVNGRKPTQTRNVYFLVYDAYVAAETMQVYGIDNRAQEDYLQSLGFVLYPHTYSLGPSTLSTMSRVMNLAIEQGVNAEINVKRAVSGSGALQQVFQQLGYRTYGVFATDYMFRGVGSTYDVTVPERETGASTLLIDAILIGEFRFNLGFDRQSHEQYMAKKQAIYTNRAGSPRFLYAHSNLPSHSQNSGACRENETALYAERLANANVEMRQDLDALMVSDPDAIIIVAGDHGPYLTKNCIGTEGDYAITEISRADVQDRYGSFLAIRWPDDGYEAYDDITVLQDVFPAVLAYLYRDPAFFQLKLPPETQETYVASGVKVNNGVIIGGVDDGEPLFLSGQ